MEVSDVQIQISAINHLFVVDNDEVTDKFIDRLSHNSNLTNRYVLSTKGFQALQYLSFCKRSNNFPDLIILDLKMADMDGLDFIENYENKFYHTYRDTKVVIASNSINDFEKDIVNSYSCVNVIVNKPWNKEKFHYIFNALYNA